MTQSAIHAQAREVPSYASSEFALILCPSQDMVRAAGAFREAGQERAAKASEKEGKEDEDSAWRKLKSLAGVAHAAFLTGSFTYGVRSLWLVLGQQ